MGAGGGADIGRPLRRTVDYSAPWGVVLHIWSARPAEQTGRSPRTHPWIAPHWPSSASSATWSACSSWLTEGDRGEPGGGSEEPGPGPGHGAEQHAGDDRVP